MKANTFFFEEVSCGFLIHVSKAAPSVVYSFLAEVGVFHSVNNGNPCYKLNTPDTKLGSIAFSLTENHGMSEADIVA